MRESLPLLSAHKSVFLILVRICNPPSSDILEDYAKKMRDAENEPHDGKRKVESVWCVSGRHSGLIGRHADIPNGRPIMRISHARSRYIYDLYYKREAISKPLYDWLLKEGYADAK